MTADKLRVEYAALCATPFPRNSSDPRVWDLFPEVVEYDGYIAGIVGRILNGESRANLHPLKKADNLLDRLERILRDPNTVDRDRISALVEYVRMIHQLVDTAIDGN